MFATLLGGLPHPPGSVAPATRAAERLSARVAAQEVANLEPLTDGQDAWPAGDPAAAVARWRATAALTTRAVKASLRGPWSMADAGARGERDVLGAAERLHATIVALAAAGCPLVEIEERAAHRIGDGATARRLFRQAHIRVARDVGGTHLSLSIVGGSAWEAGASTILDPPYQSLAVDLIAGPDNWRLVAVTPADRGIVAGALDVTTGIGDGPETLLWAAYYASSTQGRGIARVGLGPGGSLAHLTWEQATARLRVLAEAVRIIGLPLEERADAIDPRAVSVRAAATGRTRHSARARRAGTTD